MQGRPWYGPGPGRATSSRIERSRLPRQTTTTIVAHRGGAVVALEQSGIRRSCSACRSGAHCDSDGKMRLVVPFPAWDDLVRLAFDEICAYGATSVQVMRRMNALVKDLAQAVPEER